VGFRLDVADVSLLVVFSLGVSSRKLTDVLRLFVRLDVVGIDVVGLFVVSRLPIVVGVLVDVLAVWSVVVTTVGYFDHNYGYYY
jgi:hypothetical protein